MLTLLINNQQVDLLPDTSISLSMANPLFDSDFIPISHSLDIDLPATLTNRTIFGHPNRHTCGDTLLSDRSFKLYFDGLSFFEGTVSLNEWTSKYINVQLLGASIIDKLKTKLYQLNIPEINFGLAESVVSDGHTILSPSGSAQLAYQSYWRNQLLEDTPDFIATPISLAGVDKTWGCSIFNSLGGTSLVGPYIGALIPAVRIGFLLEMIIPCFEAVLADDFSRLMLITNYHPKYKGVDDRYVNSVNGGYFCLDINPDTLNVTFNLADCLPDVDCGTIVKESLKMLCASLYTIKGSPVVVFNKDVLTSTDSVDWTPRILTEITGSIIPPSNYLFSFDKSTSSEELSGEDVVTDYSDASAMVSAQNASAELQRTLDTGQVFSASIDDSLNTNNIEYTTMVDSVDFFGTPADSDVDLIELTTALQVAPCVVRIEPYSNITGHASLGYNYINCPEVDPADPGTRPTTMTIGQYVGMSDYMLGDGSQYPKINAIGDETAISLVNGDLFDKYHQTMADWYAKSRRQIKAQAKLSALDLANLDFRQKISYDGRRYLLESLDVTLTHNSIGLANIILTQVDF